MNCLTLFFASLLILTGCATTVESPGDLDDFEENDLAVVGGDSKADSLSDTAPYFQVSHDYRRCAAPYCGGYWVRLVNFSATPCMDVDGSFSWQPQCYVADLNLEGVGISGSDIDPAGKDVLLRGWFTVGQTVGTDAVMLDVDEAWEAVTDDAPAGLFYKFGDNRIRCVRAPCPTSYHEAKLNSTRDRDVGIFDYSSVATHPAIADSISRALAADRVLASGYNQWARQNGLWVVAFRATQAYVPMTSSAVSCGGFRGARCGAGEFCSYSLDAICGAADAPGTCQPIPQVCNTGAQQVCGCDGRTYNNTCEANRTGISVSTLGACPSTCVVAGCSSQICVDPAVDPTVTTCEFRAEYACYAQATCARQPSGRCGWTPTRELATCVDNAQRR